MAVNTICCYMYFTLLAAVVLSNEQIIHDFYHKLDTHSKWMYILPLLCNDFYNISSFETYYHQHIKYHMNEQNLLSIDNSLQHTYNQRQTLHINMEYSGLKWPNHGHRTICRHYNYTANISINILLRCIQSIQRDEIYHYFEDHNSTICYSKTAPYHPLNINNNNNNKLLMDTDEEIHTFSGFAFNFLDTSNVKLMSFGILSCITWTLFYIIYHIALLNYPSIYYTKTCVFTLFLASLANLTLSISIQDPFSFIPNGISIILCILQFTKYSYDLIFNFNARSLSKFVRFKKETNQIELIESNEFSNNFLAKYNPNSIPNRRKKMLYEKQMRMKANLEINFDNKEWMRRSVVSDTASNIHRFNPNTDKMNDNIDNKREYKSRVKDEYRGHGAEKIEIKVFSIIFLLISVLLHYLVIFVTEIFERNDSYRFNIIHGVLLLQWMICLTFLITWYQNYRFEYAIDKLLSDGYSLYYLLKDKNTKLQINESLNVIAQEMEALSMSAHPSLSNNDINLPTPQPSSDTVSPYDAKIVAASNNDKLKEEDEEYSDISDPDDIVMNVDNTTNNKKIDKMNKCCCCLRFISIFLLKLIRYLPWIVLLNACCWVFFGVYVCDIEVIWLQHSISIGVSGLYIIFSFCMNERHLILQKETQIVPNFNYNNNNNRNMRTRKIKKRLKKPLPTKPLPTKPLPPSPIHIK